MLVAAGCVPNTDILDVAAVDLETNCYGFIVVNERMVINVEGVWAIGDIVGKGQFRHVANEQAYVTSYNSHHEDSLVMKYHAPAVFTRPQTASVGMTEAQPAIGHNILVGYVRYSDVAKSEGHLGVRRLRQGRHRR